MHSYELLEILAVGLFLALVFGFITKRLGFSSIVGYLIAGFLVGPATPGFVGDAELAGELAEAGVILMMFGVGLHFNIKDLLAVKGVALPGAIIQSTAATICGVLVAEAFGMSLAEGLVLGMGLAVASTVVLLRVLTDNNQLNTIQGHVAVGWLVVEDILTVLVLVLLPSIAAILAGTGGAGASGIAISVGKAGLHLVLLWFVVMVLGGRLIPWLLIKVARTRSEELFTLTIVGAAFGTAVAAYLVFDISMALGAFMGGMVVGQSKLSHQAGVSIMPLKDVFSVLFFLSVGMLFSPSFLVQNWQLVLGCLIIVLAVKPLAAVFAVIVLGYSVRTAITIAAALSQVGEFSFILAQQAIGLELVSTNVYMVLVICALVSITLNPAIFKNVPRIEAMLKKRQGLWNFLNFRANRKAQAAGANQEILLDGGEHKLAIVAGYGPTGRNVVKMLESKGVTPVIIDMNVDTVNELTKEGFHAIYGDSSRADILEAAGIEKASYLIITVANMEAASGTVVAAHSLKSDIKVFSRVRFMDDAEVLYGLGVDGVAEEERAVAHSLTDLVLSHLEKGEDGLVHGACGSYLEQTESEVEIEPKG